MLSLLGTLFLSQLYKRSTVDSAQQLLCLQRARLFSFPPQTTLDLQHRRGLSLLCDQRCSHRSNKAPLRSAHCRKTADPRCERLTPPPARSDVDDDQLLPYRLVDSLVKAFFTPHKTRITARAETGVLFSYRIATLEISSKQQKAGLQSTPKLMAKKSNCLNRPGPAL